MRDYNDQVIAKAKELYKNLGGTIFAFPVEEDNPYSEYAIVVLMGGQYFVYPKASDISIAALGITTIMGMFEKEGMHIDWKKDVRFISHMAQMDAPSVIMRRLKRDYIAKPVFDDTDVMEGTEETGELISARGTIKLSYWEMVEDKNPKAAQFMDEYFKLLAIRKYGKTASAIRQEVRKMSKGEAINWIEQTYKKYIHDDTEIIDILNRVI